AAVVPVPGLVRIDPVPGAALTPVQQELDRGHRRSLSATGLHDNGRGMDAPVVAALRMRRQAQGVDTAARGIVHGGSIRHGRVACPLARAGAYQERLRSPRSPCPDLTSVLADFLTSWASERPRSSLSLNFPSSSRRTSRLSPLGAISSRLLLFLIAMLRLLEPLNQPPVGRPMHR